MGFFKNVASEFGTKTGKAIGNRMYGKYADDVRIGGSFSNNLPQENRVSQDNEAKVEELALRHGLEQEAKRENQKHELTESIIALSFDMNNSIDFAKQMFSIATRCETAINDQDFTTCTLCIAKLKEGVGLILLYEPASRQIEVYNNKIIDLEIKCRNKKRRKMFKSIAEPVLLILGFIAFFVFIYIMYIMASY